LEKFCQALEKAHDFIVSADLACLPSDDSFGHRRFIFIKGAGLAVSTACQSELFPPISARSKSGLAAVDAGRGPNADLADTRFKATIPHASIRPPLMAHNEKHSSRLKHQPGGPSCAFL
jgi:hypothetical protein